MAELYLHNNRVYSVFQLLGEHENDISYSVAWALANCPSFLNEFLQKVIGSTVDVSDVVIRLQQYESDGGITDIEIELPGRFYVIIEAKRGWNLPSRAQLEKYAERRSLSESKAPSRVLVVLTECSREYAEMHLEAPNIPGVPVVPLSWKDTATIARNAHPRGSHAEKRVLNELTTYLGGLMTMQKIDSNWVYVVSLARGTPQSWRISWIDIVNTRHYYFHPAGVRGWPKEPPNYIAFRYSGKLQSIHHIDGYEVVTNIYERIPEIPDEEWEPHFVYALGPAFSPGKEIRTGNIYRNGRVWCMLDTLFTYETISDARDLSEKRRRQEI